MKHPMTLCAARGVSFVIELLRISNFSFVRSLFVYIICRSRGYARKDEACKVGRIMEQRRVYYYDEEAVYLMRENIDFH